MNRLTPPDCANCGKLWALHDWEGDTLKCPPPHKGSYPHDQPPAVTLPPLSIGVRPGWQTSGSSSTYPTERDALDAIQPGEPLVVLRKNESPLAQDWENAALADALETQAATKDKCRSVAEAADGLRGRINLAIAAAYIEPPDSYHEMLRRDVDFSLDLFELAVRAEERVKDVTCEACGFRYGAEHPMEDGTGYKCPLCEAAAAREEISRLRDQLTEVGYLAYCIECAAKLVSTAALYRSDPPLTHPNYPTP